MRGRGLFRAAPERPRRGLGRSGASVSGFTLVEMLVTLAIIGIASALALNGMIGLSAGRRLSLASDGLAAEIDRLRVEALRTGRRERLAFEPASDQFLSTRPGAPPIAMRGAHVTVETSPDSRVEPGVIWLLPDGSSTGGRILLSAGDARIALSVSALTGLVQRKDIP